VSSEQSVFAYYPQQQFRFFEKASDILPVPDFAKSLRLSLGELFDWLLE